MAYGLKYVARYKNVNNEVRTIQLKVDGYEGNEVKVLKTNLEGPALSWGSSDKLFGNTICASQADIQLFFEEHHDLTAFVENKRTCLVEITAGAGVLGEILWSGWVEPWNAQRAYRNASYLASMTASCGLNRLSKNKFFISENNINELTYWDIVRRCLETIGIDRKIRVALHTTQNAYPAAPNPLTSVVQDIYRYFDGAVWKNCYEILADILNHFTAEISQHTNRWVIRGIVDVSLGFTDYIEYDEAGVPGPVKTWGTLLYYVNDFVTTPQAGSIQGGVISVQGATRKYTIAADMGGPRIRLQNGGLQLWGPDGLTGWNFNMPPQGNGGWKKVETGLENSPYALNIKGYAPQPYDSKRKKGIWPVRKTVLSDIEPSTWIEAAPIEIKRTDTEVTVAFEYYTSPGSSGFLYSIRFHTDEAGSKYPENLWYSPGSYETKITNEFAHNVAPAHPLVDPVTGVRQSRAKIEIVFPTKDFNNNPWSTGATFYDKAYIRFYMSIQLGSATGDNYTIYGLSGEDDGESVNTGDSNYKVSVEYRAQENDEAEPIEFITGDYSMDFMGATFLPDDKTKSTGSWRRRDKTESLSIYRATLLDRLSMTWQPMSVAEGELLTFHGQLHLQYINMVYLADRDEYYKIVRLKYQEYNRIASVTLVQLRYTDLVATDVIQKTFTDAGLIDSGTTDGGDSDGGDGVYPEKSVPTSRLNGEDAFLPGVDPDEETGIGGRVGSLFADIVPLTYVAGVESEDVVNLALYFSELYLAEQDEDLDPEYRHDPHDFSIKVTSAPTWLSEIAIGVEGDEDSNLTIAATALAPLAGTFYIYIDVTDAASGLVLHELVPVLVEPSEEFAESWPPTFDPINLYFPIGAENTQDALLTDFMDEEHAAGTGYSFQVFDAPEWVSGQTIVFMNLAVTGKPTTAGTQSMLFQIEDSIGRTSLFPVKLHAIPATKFAHTLLDTDTPAVLGSLPGSFEHGPTIDIQSKITGRHDKYRMTLKGGGETGTAIDQTVEREVTATDLGNYRMFPDSNGIGVEVGQYTYKIESFLNDQVVKVDTVSFLIYDEAYLELIKFFLAKVGATVGEISQDGTATMVNPEIGNFLAVVDQFNHDKAIISLQRDGELIGEKEYDLGEVDGAGSYSVFDTDEPIVAGVYVLTLSIFLTGSVIQVRQASFEIGKPESKPEALLQLVSFKPGTTNYSIIDNLPVKNKEYDQPVNYSVLFDGFGGTPYVSVTPQFFKLRNGSYAEYDLVQLAGVQENIVYAQAVTSGKILIFGNKNSTQVSDAQDAPARYKAIFTGRDETGSVVGIAQADFSFRIPLGPEDYSGLRFSYIPVDGGGIPVDSNMPKTGATYMLPESGSWSVQVTKLSSGATFNRAEFFGKLKIGSSFVDVKFSPGIPYIIVRTFTPPINDGTAGNYGTEGVGNPPVLYSTDGDSFLVNAPGEWIITCKVFMNGVLLETMETHFTLVNEEDFTDPPIKDCCGCEEESDWDAIEW